MIVPVHTDPSAERKGRERGTNTLRRCRHARGDAYSGGTNHREAVTEQLDTTGDEESSSSYSV